MKNKDYIGEFNDEEIEMLLKYLPEYTKENTENIKRKFEDKAKMNKKTFSFKKFGLGALAASFLFVTTLVYAEIIDLSKIYQMVFGRNAQYIEEYIEPFDEKDQESLSIESEYDGIVIKLISAINDENALRIFASITDTKADRLSKDLDFTSWGLNMGHGGNASIVDYDYENKRATMLITSLGHEHKGRAKLTLKDFATGREILENLPEENINVSSILQGHKAEIINQDQVWKSGGGGNNNKIYEESRLLKTNEMDIKFDNVDMFSISNMGFVDGLFHIQVKARLEGVALLDGYYVNAKLVNKEKEVIYNSTSRINFSNDKKYAYESHRKEAHDEYSEIIYEDIKEMDQLKDLSLVIDYMKSPKITEGEWEFSFMVPEKIRSEIIIDRDIFINGENLKIDRLSLSPLGITMHLSKNMSANYKHMDQVYIEYGDERSLHLDLSSIHTYEGESSLIFSGDIIEIESVKNIIINGEKINISQ